MPAFFITATGTDIGKTFVACALIRALRAQGRAVEAFKPVLSGFTGYAGSDAACLIEALGGSERDLDRMSPLRFEAPLAPPSAARLEGQLIALDDLAVRCLARTAGAGDQTLLIEGAGGLMSPIAEDGTNLDLIRALGLPVIVVAGSYLGSVSHTLTALRVLASQEIAVAAVVVSESEGDAPPISEMTNGLARFAADVPVIVAPRDQDWTAEALAALV